MTEQEFSAEQREALKKDAMAYILPHFADNAELAKGPKVFVRGEGCYVYDIEGHRYLDTFASLLTTICGHHRPEIKAAVLEQMDHLEFFPNYVDTFTVPLIELARKLAEIMPGDLSVSFFVNSGSEANETALKMARQYHRERGQPHRYKVVARRHSYSGTTLGGISATGIPWFREYFEPLLPGCRLRAGCPVLRMRAGAEVSRVRTRMPARHGESDRVGRAGEYCRGDHGPHSRLQYRLSASARTAICKGFDELCDKHGILLIFDEVQTGFGKTGKWFACEHWNVVPDIITIGKGFTGGYIPLGATVTTPKVADVFRGKPGCELRSGSTYGGHTVACAATLANINIIEKENLVQRAARNRDSSEGRVGETLSIPYRRRRPRHRTALGRRAHGRPPDAQEVGFSTGRGQFHPAVVLGTRDDPAEQRQHPGHRARAGH